MSSDNIDVTALAKQAVKATSKMHIRAIITDSYTGRTARYLAAFRGKYPVLAIKEKTMRLLLFLRCIYLPGRKDNAQAYFFSALDLLLKEGRLVEEDMVVYLSGSLEKVAETSFLEINKVRKQFF